MSLRTERCSSALCFASVRLSTKSPLQRSHSLSEQGRQKQLQSRAEMEAKRTPIMMALAAACLVALTGMAVADSDWRDGRATFYGDNDGSCMFWQLDYWKGTGWNIVAPSDQNWDFDQSCGRCYEVQCRPASFSDGYGQWLVRDKACYDTSKSVVVMVTDACPCYYPNNAYGNKRWCCGDSGMQHFDMSYVAFDKLAARSNGVIGIRYRQVDCPPGSPTPQQWQTDNRNRKGRQGSTY